MKKAIIFVILMLIIGGTGYYLLMRDTVPENPTTPDAIILEEKEQTNADLPLQPSETSEEAQGMPAVYTLSDIALHSEEDDCWFVIEENVYDVTPFIASGNHGGGDAILEGCGKDATELFQTRPMGSGTPHSDTARSILSDYQIGLLGEE